MDFAKFFLLPEDASLHGYKIDIIIYLIHILMFVLFVGWGIYFIYVLFRFSKKRNPKANYHGGHGPFSTVIEVGVVVFEAVLLLGFSIPFWQSHINKAPSGDNAVEVRLVAEQFAWNIHYPGPDNLFGRVDVEFFDKANNPLGLDPNDPAGKDDFVMINQMYVPIGKPVVIHLSSKDVIHSLNIPSMRIKQDAIPGLSIPVWFTPTKTGKYEIACAQLCGIGHYRMKGYLTVLIAEEYDAWVQEQVEAAAQGADEDDFWN